MLSASNELADYRLMGNKIDYRVFYDDESYLFDVCRQIRKNGTLSPGDFYMLLAWKANRAKNYHRERLKHQASSFQPAVAEIASDLWSAGDWKGKLQLLMAKWCFALPTASAILSILYPDEFTVYDQVVCGELHRPCRPWLAFSDRLWSEYQEYKQAVIAATPKALSLRDKDRFLIGRAYRKGAQEQCEM